MTSYMETIGDSIRSNGRDTLASKPTNFIDVEALSPPPPPPTEPVYEMWTDEHSAQSKARRENRENRAKPPPVAEVPDFDINSHLKEREENKTKKLSKWKIW